MIWHPFKKISKSFLGIDIGTSSIKIVEISPQRGDRAKLENYGELPSQAVFEKPFKTFSRSTLLLSESEVASAISAIIEEGKLNSREAIFSLPDFSSFFTNFTLPAMPRKELDQAIRYEARLHVPLPLSEVTLDWRVIEGSVDEKKGTPLKILLVSVPNETIAQYQRIANLTNLKLRALEAEVFALLRSLVYNREKSGVISLVDIGAQSTTCNIVEERVLKISHSFDLAGNNLTNQLTKSLGISWEEAEDLQKKEGLLSPTAGVREVLLPIIDSILIEIEKTFNSFYMAEGKRVKKIILAGGVARLAGLKEYFSEKFVKMEIEIANPFLNIFYPPQLEAILRERGPSYAVAVGLALRGLEL